MKKNFVRWIIFFWIGVITASIGIIIDLSIENIANIKFGHIKQCILLYLFIYFIYNIKKYLYIKKTTIS